jgi:hypothetical protein
MKKKLKIRKKITLNIFKKVTSLHIKKPMKKTVLTLTSSKMKVFSKFKKKNDYLNYLAKFGEQHFSKTHFHASESAKNTFL